VISPFLRAAASSAAILALAAPIAAPAQAPAPATPAPFASPAADVTRATLDNGLRVVIVRDPLAPVATVYDNYLVGADETPAGFPGMAHAQEHMAFRGCAGVNADQTSAIIAQLGSDGDADTQQTITQYYSSVPAADLDVALHLDAACMRDIDDSDAQWKQERGAIEQEVAQDNSNPQYKAITRIFADMFAGTPYAHDPLGTRPSFDKTTGALLKTFYRQWYAPNNAILVIAGDVDPQKTLATIKAYYGAIPAHALPARPAVDLPAVKAEAFSLDSDLPYVLSFTGYRVPGYDDPDYAATQVLFDVLGSQRGNVYALGADGKALAAGAQIAETYPKAGLGIVYGALPAGGDPSAFTTVATGIVADYLKNGLPADLVDAAKSQEVAAAEYERNSIDTLAGTWSEALAGEGRQSPDEDVAAIAAVTVDDVNRVAKKYLVPSNAVTANLIPKPSGNAVSAHGFGGGEVTTAQPTKPVILPPWAAAQLAKVTVPDSTLAPADVTLPNGLRLIVQPETASDTVTVVGSVLHQDDVQTAHGKEGVEDVLEGLFSYGTTSLDRLAFAKALDDISATESAGPSFSLHVLKANFDRGVQLLADNELNPALPAPAFAIVQQQTAQTLAGQLKSPDYIAERTIDRALLPPGDPELREATPATVNALTLPDVQKQFGTVFRPDMTTIVVIGNVTPADARATIEKYFGTWSATGPKPNVDLPKVPLSKAAAAVVPDASRVQDETSLIETVNVTRTSPDYYALELGDHVLGGGFYATRLYHDLRQVAGLVYNVSNRLSAGRTRATYAITYGSDPPNVSKARRLAERDLRAMQTTNVSAAELQQAKAILLRQLPLAESSEDDVASSLAGDSISGLPLDEAHRAAEIYAKLSAAQVRAAFAKHIRPAAFVQVVQGPTPS
jgi:zinc protease